MEASTRRRTAMGALLATGLAVFALLLGACSPSSDNKTNGVADVATSGQPSGQANGSADGSGSGQKLTDQQLYDGLLKYSKCMRQHGVTKFPDPVLGQGLQVNGNAVDGSSPTYKAADTACKSLLPAGGGGDNPTQDRALGLKHSQCMRDHGVKNFPDPNANGGANLDGDKIGMAPDNPIYVAADKACAQYAGGSAQNNNKN